MKWKAPALCSKNRISSLEAVHFLVFSIGTEIILTSVWGNCQRNSLNQQIPKGIGELGDDGGSRGEKLYNNNFCSLPDSFLMFS